MPPTPKANPFETGDRKVVPAVLVYVRHDERMLMIHRDGRPGDYHSGKWNGLGGKLELDESPVAAARRELREESGIDLSEDDFRPLGTLQFPNFKAHKNEDWVVWVFTARVKGVGHLFESAEGSLHWVPTSEILGLNLWAGDRHFLPLVIEERPFYGTIWYRGQEVLRHEVRPYF